MQVLLRLTLKKIKFQKVYSSPRNLEAGNILPMLFLKKPLCKGHLSPACEFQFQGDETKLFLHENQKSWPKIFKYL